jgi:hypothetical protein
MEVLDLGCGTGANLRHLAPRLAAVGWARQHWTCMDHDPLLLRRLPTETTAWAARQQLRCAPSGDGLRIHASGWSTMLTCLQIDLAAQIHRLRLPAGGLVTASALLDLVSAPWLQTLLERCRADACALLFVLSYDGRCALEPPHRDDARVIELVNRHQRTDKGFGPALGPAAVATAAAHCAKLGYRVQTAASDWCIGPGLPGLQRSLIGGWRDAAAAMTTTGATDWLDAWHAARLGHIESASSRLLVGHVDLLAMP